MKTIPIIMPQMGQSVAEGTIIKWRKKVGDAIKADESILEVVQAIRGTGRQGRGTRNDLLKYLSGRPVNGSSSRATHNGTDATPGDLAELGEVIPMTSMRRTIADHMVQSIHTSAHVTMVHAVDMTHIVALRERI